MRWRIPLLVVMALCAEIGSASADPTPATASLFTRRDLAFGLAAVGFTAAAVPCDKWLTNETTEAHSAGERRLANALSPLGSGALVFGALAATYGASRFLHHEGLTASVTRVGTSVLVSGITVAALKEGIGRQRPLDSPNDSDDLRPFHGDTSMPSGHTTLAFALATAVSHESHSRWVPWVVYPLASAVAWSRVHEQEHWTSDVVAGAFLGAWTAAKTERYFDLNRR
jgi:membrane-associated phospholipid phosphatase